MFDFRLDIRTREPVYLQLVHQVKRAVALGEIREGDQLPTVNEVVHGLLVSPNTVLKAYRELDREGVVWSRHGVGTFVRKTVSKNERRSAEALRRHLTRWLREARSAGLDDGAIDTIIELARREAGIEVVA